MIAQEREILAGHEKEQANLQTSFSHNQITIERLKRKVAFYTDNLKREPQQVTIEESKTPVTEVEGATAKTVTPVEEVISVKEASNESVETAKVTVEQENTTVPVESTSKAVKQDRTKSKAKTKAKKAEKKDGGKKVEQKTSDKGRKRRNKQ